MIYLLYFGIALVSMGADAYFCLLSHKRYRVGISALFSIIWPITTPLILLGITGLTTHYPKIKSIRKG